MIFVHLVCVFLHIYLRLDPVCLSQLGLGAPQSVDSQKFMGL